MSSTVPFWKPSNLSELLTELDRRERKYGPLGYVTYTFDDKGEMSASDGMPCSGPVPPASPNTKGRVRT